MDWVSVRRAESLLDGLYQPENPYAELKRLMFEKPLGPSHVEDGGGDTHEKTSVVHQQGVNQWLIGLQPEIVHKESPLERERKQQKERLKDSKHCLRQDWRFANVILQVKDLGAGRLLRISGYQHMTARFTWTMRDSYGEARLRRSSLPCAISMRTESRIGYACFKTKPFQNLSHNLFPPRRFSPTGNSAEFNGTA
jgi:hypothetical protein